MRNLLTFFIVVLALFGCKDEASKKTKTENEIEFNQALADELKRMAEVDQVAANFPLGKYKAMSSKDWKAFKDSVFTNHQKRLKEMFDKHGFVGFDLAGKEGSFNFWLMTQHSDHNPAFQKEVLKSMKIEVDNGNADPNNYGYLIDRVNLNTGVAQIYGTQVDYNLDTGQAFPKNLADSANVNKRRNSIGLEPLEEYLNDMSIMHFEMSKKHYTERGITNPKLYKIE